MSSFPRKVRTLTIVGVLVIVAATLIITFGTGTSPKSKANVVHSACQKVTAVLSDGPDPSADPVGYAEAMILPLGQIKTSDPELQTAIDYLDTTYRLFYETNGSHASAKTVRAARRFVAVYCPGIGT
jgi:hypothetical protein